MKGGSVPTLKSRNETILLTGTSLPTEVVATDQSQLVLAVLDSGASVSVVNRKVVNNDKVQKGRRIVVEDYCANPSSYDEWCEILVRIDTEAKTVRFLIVDGAKYDMLLSRKVTKDFKLNLHFDDTISLGYSHDRKIPMKANVYLKQSFDTFEIESMKDIETYFPGVISPTPYPEPVRKFAVPFVLNDTSPICRKRYVLSRAKQE